jgi:hypothetical protein
VAMSAAGDAHDRLINHLFRSGLSLAAVLSLPRVEGGVAARLRDVLDQLDAAIGEVRHLALTAALTAANAQSPLSRMPAQPEPTRSLHLGTEHRRSQLCRFAVDEVFAYALSGHDFYRVSDDELWAHECDGFLLAPHSGVPFARRVGRAFCEVESAEPLYYERA